MLSWHLTPIAVYCFYNSLGSPYAPVIERLRLEFVVSPSPVLSTHHALHTVASDHKPRPHERYANDLGNLPDSEF